MTSRPRRLPTPDEMHVLMAVDALGQPTLADIVAHAHQAASPAALLAAVANLHQSGALVLALAPDRRQLLWQFSSDTGRALYLDAALAYVAAFSPPRRLAL